MPAPRRSKLRSFHWTVIPAERVRGRPSVWTASSRHDRTPLDVAHLEELFGEQPGWGPRGPLLLGRPQGQVSLLDSKKILNLEIFLKQFKRPVQQIVADLRAGAGALYGAEKLLELCKMLPDADEGHFWSPARAGVGSAFLGPGLAGAGSGIVSAFLALGGAGAGVGSAFLGPGGDRAGVCSAFLGPGGDGAGVGSAFLGPGSDGAGAAVGSAFLGPGWDGDGDGIGSAFLGPGGDGAGAGVGSAFLGPGLAGAGSGIGSAFLALGGDGDGVGSAFLGPGWDRDGDGVGSAFLGPGLDGDGVGSAFLGPGSDGAGVGSAFLGPGSEGDGVGSAFLGPGSDGDGVGSAFLGPGSDGDGVGSAFLGPGLDGDGDGSVFLGPGWDGDGDGIGSAFLGPGWDGDGVGSAYARRLELLVLKEEFFPQLNSLKSSIQILTEAARELLGCEELHVVIRLVLRAGNYMNTGGYAGHAAGFRMASLLRLADTKANKPGVDLLHFVAMEAERKDRSLLDFPSKLEHVGLASRIQEQEVASELQGLGERLAGARGSLPELGPGQLEPFLQLAQAELGTVQAELERLRQDTATLRDFYCEDEALFCLQEVCAVLHAFGGRFRTAVQENRAREQAEQRRQQLERQRQEKRRSIATCSAQEPELQDVELDFLLMRTPHLCRRSRIPRGLRTGPCGSLDLGAGVRPDRAALPEPSTRETGQRHLSRRHTLAILPAHPEPQDSLGPAPAPPPGPPATPVGRKGGLMSWLPERLPSPGASPKAVGCSLDTSPSRSFPSLFRKKAPSPGAEGQAGPVSPTASPKGVSTLASFFWRLTLAEKPLRPSQS
ncbi:hypothetical protein KIL84_020311 [Mauremys mutica]|uniref:FH2 domain-containing protein n=1 Tax=Mauremys mutica TaxID=74926 RepID=A0A9D3XXE1_9SAUR|nr:hypothetical protein KIL84_020311 [Mauremys mutica]